MPHSLGGKSIAAHPHRTIIVTLQLVCRRFYSLPPSAHLLQVRRPGLPARCWVLLRKTPRALSSMMHALEHSGDRFNGEFCDQFQSRTLTEPLTAPLATA